mmetsp:Transcript_111462/g.209063  ORF Transcript_111462/g.209063 Transcript_111462/m.209063 type:complete len:80 (+) Transcript_111462:61-300(+)
MAQHHCDAPKMIQGVLHAASLEGQRTDLLSIGIQLSEADRANCNLCRTLLLFCSRHPLATQLNPSDWFCDLWPVITGCF